MALATASLIHPDRGLQSGRVFPRIFLGEKEMQKKKNAPRFIEIV